MEIFPRPLFASLLVIPLLAFVLLRGILPAFTQLDTDFPNYYTAGRLVAGGTDLSRIYDDAWFQHQMIASGIDRPGKFSPFPPLTALLFVPFSVLDPLDALRAMTVLNILCLVLCAMVLARILVIPLRESALIVLLGGIGLANCFRFGQLYLFVALSMMLAYLLFQRGKPFAAGLLLGLFIPVKYFPAALLLALVLDARWRVVAGGVLSTLGGLFLGIVALGWEVHRQYFGQVLGSHLMSDFSGQNPYSPAFQSWDSLLRRLFLHDPRWNPQPLLSSPELFATAKLGVLLLLAIVCGLAVIRLLRMREGSRTALLTALLTVFALLIAPGTATYHYILLWLPTGLLLAHLHRAGRRKLLYGVFGIFGAIGLLPYAFFLYIGRQGFLTILAYPRLLLVLGLFLCVVYVAWNAGRLMPHPSPQEIAGGETL